MTNSTSTSSSNELEEKFLDNIEENSDLEDDGVTKKHPGAFRTISEVAEEIHVPQHVLRFWETRFKQVQPVKRSGGRRYYRSEDITLLQYISELLYTQGYTIKGVQRLLDEDFSKFSPQNELVEEEATEVSTALTHEEVKEEENHFSDSTEINEQFIQHEENNADEMTRLKEQNVLLTQFLRAVLDELQELRKIIAS
ncbi:DNA-binding transcriptional regulator [Commensalibacter communis]|uniref:MerR family (SoxR) n=1 Tax=Commensalibacter communis TaxID=2972786 RepID=A0A9W4TPZ1_9PROT|nr:MerR family transcriptional regulator [Commensalibacter communis]CAI3929874.1 DNA-binding transcriptional regulator [Commensalibacter communis]CAI3930457.1 DNA-binding transcriptional regulator [Commensalibacter communis]CAI3931023.1 DNA-binding transcriptional regulator [Commensalibacter communis]CAI3932557.1 DNA-binding transcriptional regulator [Commensalibacter communis]